MSSPLVNEGGVPEVQIANQPDALEAGRQPPALLLDVTYTGKTANFNETAKLNLTGYQFCMVSIYVTSAWTGTTPTLQLDLLEITDDSAETTDFFNNGPHSGGFQYSLGPGASINQLLPKNLSFAYVIAGTTPVVNFRVIVQAW